ncbi:MAG TPA: restriction endonuclease subunit S, partial [Ghiorsea sp.]|nr:restriction endonuclease subunit S [Ghiorsea sp.]
MEIKAGYKQTEVGVIPDDWEKDQLGDLVMLMTNGFVGIAKSHYVENQNGVLYLQGYNVEENYFNLHGVKYVTDEFHKAHMKSCLQYGDLLTVQTGDVGLTAYVPDNLVGSNCHALIISRFDKKSAHSLYISYYLNSYAGRARLRLIETGTTMKHLNIGDMLQFYIPLPPTIKEQQAIATALSDMDALLEGLDQLIAKKRDIKQAIMQQLLTGKTRLAEFEGEWETKRLGSIGLFMKGKGVKKSETDSGDIPCVRYGEIYTYHNDYIRQYYSWISRDVAARAVMLKKGDLLFAGSGETKKEIGKCVAFIDDHETYAGGDIVILRPEGINSIFLSYYCNTETINTQKSSKGQGDAVVHISAMALSDIQITLPSLPEQTAIAKILTDIDTEIEALEKRRAKTKNIKQAMMQELLTG